MGAHQQFLAFRRLGRAREMCPEIQTMPFEFDLYKK